MNRGLVMQNVRALEERFLSKIIQKSRLCPSASDTLILRLAKKDFSDSELQKIESFKDLG